MELVGAILKYKYTIKISLDFEGNTIRESDTCRKRDMCKRTYGHAHAHTHTLAHAS